MNWPSLEYTDKAKIVMKYEGQDCDVNDHDANRDVEDDDETTLDWRSPICVKRS